MSLIDRLHGHVQEGGLTQRDYKYRCVQTITTKLDEIPVSTIVSKKDYSVERFMDAEGTQGFAFSVKDDIPSIFPEQYVESITLINDKRKTSLLICFLHYKMFQDHHHLLGIVSSPRV